MRWKAVGNLQPKAEYWTQQRLFVGGDRSLEATVTARIFADNLPQPIEIPLKFLIQSEQRVYRLADFVGEAKE
jgi:hypothetical protein